MVAPLPMTEPRRCLSGPALAPAPRLLPPPRSFQGGRGIIVPKATSGRRETRGAGAYPSLLLLREGREEDLGSRVGCIEAASQGASAEVCQATQAPSRLVANICRMSLNSVQSAIAMLIEAIQPL